MREADAVRQDFENLFDPNPGNTPVATLQMEMLLDIRELLIDLRELAGGGSRGWYKKHQEVAGDEVTGGG